MRTSLALLAGGALALASCSTAAPEPESPLGNLSEFHGDLELKQSSSLGCEAMIDRYCDTLFSPSAMGNLRIGRVDRTFTVFRGRTRNDFSATYYFYASEKLRRRNLLPADFRRALEEQGYFTLLGRFLERPPRQKMLLEDRLADVRSQNQLGALWSGALQEVTIRRLRESFPDYHRMRDELVPTEARREARRIRRKLVSEISVALWRDHGNWKRVVASFEVIRGHFLETIPTLSLSPEAKARWVRRIKEVRLVLPGSVQELADDDCSTTDTNAYYYPHLNALTVCAGDFNSEDIYQTLAHELAHAVDLESMAYAHRLDSALGRGLSELRRASCGPAPVQCRDWAAFKGAFPRLLRQWREFRPDRPEVHRCLKAQPTERKLSEEALDQAARDRVTETFAGLADENAFVRLTKERLPRPDGTWEANHDYLNACRVGDGTDPFDEEENALLFFALEYRCHAGAADRRLRESISVAKGLSRRLIEASLRMEGEFSDDEGLKSQGYSSSSSERFADVLGSYALSRLLDGMPDRWSRRKLYLASSSWQCNRPSLSKAFPLEAKVEREFSLDSHSAGKDRQRENLSQPVRGALGCVKDFDFDECSLR